jgi:two-component system, LytTR family, sensor kinase
MNQASIKSDKTAKPRLVQWATRWKPACGGLSLRTSLLVSALLVIGILVLGISFSALLYFIYASTGSPIRWGQAFSLGLSQWWAWTLLYSLLFWITRKWPLTPQRWWRGAVFYLVVAVAVTLLKLALDVVWLRLLWDAQKTAQLPVRSLLALAVYFNFLTCCALIGVGHALNFYRSLRERELQAAQLETQLTQAQLAALRMQLQPHFLFNTLHTIAMLNLTDSKAANRMLTRLSDLLRLALDSAGTQEVPLRQELEFLRRYLEIEQIRFQDRLTVQLDVDPASLDGAVPNLLLQPIVENALRHGVANQEADARLEIHTIRQNGSLLLRVRDNGPGLSTGAETKPGIGLKNTRARLERLYGTAQRFELQNMSGGGLEVSIALPWHEFEAES